MNVYVCIKQVPDTEATIVPKEGGTIDATNIKWIMCPYDEYAVEEAVSFKENHPDCTLVAVSLGPDRVQETIRLALALGADRGIHIVCDEYLDHILVAKALANAIKDDGEYHLVFAGKQATDDDGYQVPQRLAHSLKAAVATGVVAFKYEDGIIRVTKDVGGGVQEKLELAAPAVITAGKGLNEPRYPKLPNIMKAKRKEIKKLSLADAGITEIENHQTVIEFVPPPEKSGGRVLTGEKEDTVPELVQALNKEAKVI
ncbi:MAG: electron transfer flavoprotein subunit beta/FixA family protein [bacterium]|jgi:electron transfer flavoprotein beta subunit|nr:electron transfer flavoprotein subunit beta/FixA family protein [bacterium]